jgi:hypothetical protein
VVKRGGKEYQNFPPLHDSHALHQPHYNLEDSQGNTLLDHADIEEELVTYYKELLSEPPVDRMPTIRKVTQHIPTLITAEQNMALMRPISQEEVDHPSPHYLKGYQGNAPLGKPLGPASSSHFWQ